MSLRRMLIALLLMGLTGPVYGQSWGDAVQGLNGRELVLRPTVENRRKVYLPTNSPNEEAYVLFRGNRLFPLRASEPVRVRDLDINDDNVEVELESVRLGRGRVDFHGPTPSPERFQTWLDEVFEVTTPQSDFAAYVGNTRSQTLHLRGANHLPTAELREHFHSADDAAGYRECGVCFMPTPDVPDFTTERALGFVALRQVRATFHPLVNESEQERVNAVGSTILAGWPTPLKGYRYRFNLLDDDEVNAFAVPAGQIFVTRGLLEALESDDELAALLAHEIAHVENRHSYRTWRNAQTASTWLGIANALAGVKSEEVADLITQMTNFAASLFLMGHNRDRERESDIFASLYLNAAGIEDAALNQLFRKLKSQRDAIDPFRQGGETLFATHPGIDERLERTTDTLTAAFPPETRFRGTTRNGAEVVIVTLNAQRLYRSELYMLATLSTTAELGRDDNVNTIKLRAGGREYEFKERTAEKIFPSDEVSALFRADADSLIEDDVTGLDLKLRNVDGWERLRP